MGSPVSRMTSKWEAKASRKFWRVSSSVSPAAGAHLSPAFLRFRLNAGLDSFLTSGMSEVDVLIAQAREGLKSAGATGSQNPVTRHRIFLNSLPVHS